MNDTKSILKSQRLLPDHFMAYFWDTRFTGRELLDWPDHAYSSPQSRLFVF
ncbi:MAG: hypothetical protein JRE64_21130 [Deltaproteobacteria bacterium]|nr:hypothetical protein [Deltaproteobacteria bacterium]